MDARRVTERALFNLRDEFPTAQAVRVIAAGKAAWGMAVAASAALGDRITGGLVTTARSRDEVEAHLGPQWRAFAAGHPRPTPQSEAAGRTALTIASETARQRERLLVCLSGGASAMLAVPAAGLSLDDKLRATTALLRAGASIDELNLVRRHLSGIKGGQLAARAARPITLAISDVCVPVDDDPQVIGSGPTVGATSTAAGALDVLRRHDLDGALLSSVVRYLEAAAARPPADRPLAPDDRRLQGAAYWVIASRATAMQAAADAARRFGYTVHVRRDAVVGPAAPAGADLVAAAAALERPGCLISSGETTVAVRGGGRGGRNLELALGALEPLTAMAPAALASIGTDGVDGVTDAAGAFVDHTMWSTLGGAAAARRDDALARNDALPLLDAISAVVRTGPTGTNVGDLQVILKTTPGVFSA